MLIDSTAKKKTYIEVDVIHEYDPSLKVCKAASSANPSCVVDSAHELLGDENGQRTQTESSWSNIENDRLLAVVAEFQTALLCEGR